MTLKKPKKSQLPSKPPAAGKNELTGEIYTPNFNMVAIGASAGGYEACAQLLAHLPANTGMAFIVVQHLHPDHPSALTVLLGRMATMPVLEIKDGMLVESDHVYIIPPKTALEIFHGRLQLTARNAETPHLPIDRFMRSMASDQGSKSIGVILSGTASDGVMGLQAIKAVGGITLAQDEDSAKYTGMPHSAIAAGCVDFILPPEKIAQELTYIAHHPNIQLGKTTNSEIDPQILLDNKEELNKLFLLMRNATGIDFTYYKMPTLQRRINRRMVLLKFEKITEYVKYLQANPDEVDALYQDILINVTEFFRDKDAFETLKKDIFPRIIGSEKRRNTVRIWIPGCSTGEEAYSIAIALLEFFDRGETLSIQIFATDIDDQAIVKARQGIYRESISDSVSKQRLQRFFTKVDGGYQIKKNIRDLCIFAKQNVFKDPPFSKIDLISCRNLLIYLGPSLQKRIFSVFHYALVPKGILFLGSAETLGEQAQLFKIVDQKHKFYSKKSISAPLNLDFAPPSVMTADERKIENQSKKYESWSNIDLQQKTDRLIIQKYVPAAVLINEQMQILQFRGHTGRYIEPASGEASLSLMKMVREGLMLHLRGLLQKAMEGHLFVRKEKLQYNYNGNLETTDIEITPIQHPTQSEFCYLIVFEESNLFSTTEQPSKTGVKNSQDVSDDKQLLALTQELAATKEYLQSVIEQQEVSNEELRSANEEIQSSNEELQSINEELETAKEELQSTNEELATVNDELETRNTQLARLNDDHSNFVTSLNIAFITVDSQLCIRNFTPKAKDMMNIIDYDIGRPLTDIKLKVQLPKLEELIQHCIDRVAANQIEFQDDNNHWYSMRIHPYRTSDNRIDGAVIAFLDVNDIKISLNKSTAALNYADAIISAIHHPLLVLDKNLKVLSASQSYYDVFKVSHKNTVGNLLYHLGNGGWAIPKLREQLEDVVNNGVRFDNFRVDHHFENIGKTSVDIFGRQISCDSPKRNLVLMQIELVK